MSSDDALEHAAADVADGADPQSAEPTGVRAADEARRRLADVDDAELDDRVEVFEDVHRQLQEGLADLDES